MKLKISTRQFLCASILLCYLIPLLFFAYYSMRLVAPYKSWPLLSFGLLVISSGTCALILLLYCWEQAIRYQVYGEQASFLGLGEQNAKVMLLESVSQITDSLEDKPSGLISEGAKELYRLQINLKEAQERQNSLLEDLQTKQQEIFKLEEEKKQLLSKTEQVLQDFADYKLFSEEQLKQKSLQMNSLQQNFEDQRTEMEKRQEQIQQLDTKVHDLSYEIKTLLYLNEDKPTSPLKEEKEGDDICLLINSAVNTPTEAANLLRRCVQHAQKLTNSQYHGNETSRYRELSSSHYILDQRRLFDLLRQEEGFIFVYSQREQKIIFVNAEVKNILGWGPEKFIQDFFTIIQEGLFDWKRALSLLNTSPESQTRLLMKTKNGQEIMLNCHLGGVTNGFFRHYIIGIFYPT